MFNPYGQQMYNPYQNNLFNSQNNTLNSFSTQGQQVIKVHGKEGINALNIAPNSTMLCLDETEPIVWFIQTDGAGYKTPTAYDIVPHIAQEVKLQNNLEARIQRLEEIVNVKSNIKSNESNEHNKQKSNSNDNGI